MATSLQNILNHQKDWAKSHGIGFDKDGYTFSLDNNLYMPLSPETRAEFMSGGGDELGGPNERGKMQAMHSSSALVCNVFEYWRNQNTQEIARACCARNGLLSLRFESTYPTGLRGTPPHLDAEFQGTKQKPLAIESKFTEPYYQKIKNAFNPSYFTTTGIWSDIPRCKKLARKIGDNEILFSRLGASQLLKHILGLKRAFPGGFTLLYLWFDIQTHEANVHRDEIEIFRDHIQDEVDFRDMTYQSLFESIQNIADVSENYLSYLAERYFKYGSPAFQK